MVKALHRLQICWKITKRDTLSPFFDKNQFFQLLTIPIFLLLALMAGNIMENILSLSHTFTAITLTFPIWFMINLILSPFRMLKEEKDSGVWVNNQFVFHEPKLIKTLVIEPKGNTDKIDIVFSDTPKNTFVNYKIEYDGGISKIQVGGVFMNMWDNINRDKQSGGFLYEGGAKVLLHCPQNSDQTIVRIYQKSWKIQ